MNDKNTKIFILIFLIYKKWVDWQNTNKKSTTGFSKVKNTQLNKNNNIGITGKNHLVNKINNKHNNK